MNTIPTIISSKWLIDRKTLFPFELFIKFIYHYNYLLHSEKINSIEEIENESFKCYIKQLPELFGDNSNCSLYKNILPINYYNNVLSKKFVKDDIKIPFRGSYKNINMTEVEIYKDAYDQKTFINYINTTDVKCIIGENKYPKFVSDFKNIIDNFALIPCRGHTDFNYINKLDIEKKKYIGELSDHINYETFINHLSAKGINKCYEKKKEVVSDFPVVQNNSKLYWVDLHKIHFKHAIITNNGEIQREEAKITSEKLNYTICNNGIKIKEYLENLDKTDSYFTELMKTEYKETKNPIMCPLDVFIADGILFSHDHKRIAASILGGARYLIGCINQNDDKISKRSVGYHVEKCLFSKNDKSMLIYFSEEDMKKYGHYFILIGGTDKTKLMETISSTKINDRFKYFDKQSKLFNYIEAIKKRINLEDNNFMNNIVNNFLDNYDAEVDEKKVFKSLHKQCNPSFIKYLELDNIRDNYIKLLNKKIINLSNKLRQERLDTQDKPDSQKQSDPQKLLGSGNNKYLEKYLKYKLKYLAMKNKNKIGGVKFDLPQKTIDILTSLQKEIIYDIENIATENKIEDIEFKFRQFKQPENLKFPILFEFFSKTKDPKSKGYGLFSIQSIIFGIKNYTPKTKEEKDAFIDEITRLFYRQKIEIIEKPKQEQNPSKKKPIDTKKEVSTESLICSLSESLSWIKTVSNINDLLNWEINNICTNIGEYIELDVSGEKKIEFYEEPTIEYILNDENIHDIVKIVLKNKFNNVFIKSKDRVTRYNKTDVPELEDLVLLLRVACEYELCTPADNKQLVSLEKLISWQKKLTSKPDKPIKQIFKYLSPENLKRKYPLYDGKFSHELLNEIIKKQKADHMRVFKTENGHYGAYQGLNESLIYTELKEYSFTSNGLYTIHLTKPEIAKIILSGKGEHGSSLVLLGRYIHGLVNIKYTKDSAIPYTLDDTWKFKLRLYKRFDDRVGIVIDMKKLYIFYKELCVEWKSVCGVNSLGTIIFLKKVPPHVLITKDREINFIKNDCIVHNSTQLNETFYDKLISQYNINNPGEPYKIKDIFELDNIQKIVSQFNKEYDLLL